MLNIVIDKKKKLGSSSSAGMVDTIFADVAQPDQARFVAINAHHFLKTGGHCVISIKVRNIGTLRFFLSKDSHTTALALIELVCQSNCACAKNDSKKQ